MMSRVGKVLIGLLLGASLAAGGAATPLAQAAVGSRAPGSGPLLNLGPPQKQSASQQRAQDYRYAMLAGYSAADRGDYHTALINFRRALAVRPGDRYATAAIRNMETYIAQERAQAAKLAEIKRRQEILAAAVAASDWACAAASVDRLVVLVPPDSPDRARLIAYRGELTGFIQARNNLDQWSTVCPGGQV